MRGYHEPSRHRAARIRAGQREACDEPSTAAPRLQDDSRHRPGRILDWLPSLPTIVGLALATTWLADRSRENYPLAAGVLVVLGLVGFAARFDVLKRLLPSAQVIWAILLVVAGGYMVWRAIARARASG